MIECRHFAGSEDIYNPFSQLNSQSDKMFGSYWFETATPTFLIERIDGAMERMKSFIAGIPYGLENKSEKHFQTIIYLIFSLLGYYTQAEVKSAIARADAVCWTKNRIYVFEFKVDGSADEALRRIDEKGNLIPYRFEGAEGGKAASAAESVTKLVTEPIKLLV